MAGHSNPKNYTELEKIFHPQSVAIVGVPSGSGQATMASGFLNSLLELKFQEIHSLYPGNPKMDEVEGLKCYKKVVLKPYFPQSKMRVFYCFSWN